MGIRRIKCLYMALLFRFEDILDGEEYTGLLHIAEFIVDSRSENLHCRRQAHVGIHKRGNIDAMIPDSRIKYTVVLLEIVAGKH